MRRGRAGARGAGTRGGRGAASTRGDVHLHEMKTVFCAAGGGASDAPSFAFAFFVIVAVRPIPPSAFFPRNFDTVRPKKPSGAGGGSDASSMSVSSSSPPVPTPGNSKVVSFVFLL